MSSYKEYIWQDAWIAIVEVTQQWTKHKLNAKCLWVVGPHRVLLNGLSNELKASNSSDT